MLPTTALVAPAEALFDFDTPNVPRRCRGPHAGLGRGVAPRRAAHSTAPTHPNPKPKVQTTLIFTSLLPQSLCPANPHVLAKHQTLRPSVNGVHW